MQTIGYYIVFTILFYIALTLTEWTIHRYLMHGDERMELSRHHKAHHRITERDMSLSTVLESEGLYFGLREVTFILTMSIVIGFLIQILIGSITRIWISPWYIISLSLFTSVYIISFWNTIHPELHGRPIPTCRDGAPGWMGWKTIYSNLSFPGMEMNVYEWFQKNHIMHHLRKGDRKGNYNVTLPGADFILGTYHTCE